MTTRSVKVACGRHLEAIARTTPRTLRPAGWLMNSSLTSLTPDVRPSAITYTAESKMVLQVQVREHKSFG